MQRAALDKHGEQGLGERLDAMVPATLLVCTQKGAAEQHGADYAALPVCSSLRAVQLLRRAVLAVGRSAALQLVATALACGRHEG